MNGYPAGIAYACCRFLTMRLRLLNTLLFFALAFAPPVLPGQVDGTTAELHRGFLNPPDSSRIMVRWWWFGPAATRPEITRELEQMRAAGIGGVEIAHLYALALDDPATGFRNTPFLSPEHLEALRFAVQEARRLGLRVDITLGSGWPFGGPEIPVTHAAGMLRVEKQDVPPGATSLPAPAVEHGEERIDAYLLPASATSDQVAHATAIAQPARGRYDFAASDEPRTLISLIASRTGMMVKRPAAGAEGFVLDHYDREATDLHLKAVGDKLLSAFGNAPPYAVFSDSLEDYGSDWTPAMFTEFQHRRGYDLRPHLLALVTGAGPETAAIRHDWGRTLTELANDNFLAPIESWAHAHHTLFRSQTYGYPPVSLSSNRIEDLPEGEGKASLDMGRQFSDTRWAASAGHLFGRNVISSETWTWLHSPAFRATPLDFKAEADLHFLQGINQLVGHGWPYSPPSAVEPGWRMYAATALNAHNPWFFVMPDLARYLQRVSFALRQGKPANDVALLLPTDDVWASFKTRIRKNAPANSGGVFDKEGSNVSLDESMGRFLGKQVVAQVLDAGFNLDFIDADAIDRLGIPYRVLILPGIDRIPVATYEKIAAFVRAGGIVIATRRLPATAPGFLHAVEESKGIDALSQALFRGNLSTAHFVPDEMQLGLELAKDTAPDITLVPPTPQIGFIHRQLGKANLYFVANTSNEPKHVQAHFRDTAARAEAWDPFTGDVAGLPDPKSVELDLAPYESRLIYFAGDAAEAKPEPQRHESVVADLSRQWQLIFGSSTTAEPMDQLVSWTANPKTQFFSGQATYERKFTLDRKDGTATYLLDFGAGTPEPPPPSSPTREFNMRAYLESPVRDAAAIYVNGKLAGDVWHPPFRIDVTKLVHEGANDLRIIVGNTAINAMSGEQQPDYRLLWLRYGKLFTPQDMENLHPLPSGIFGPVKLIQLAP